MTQPSNAIAFHTSIRTAEGRVMVHITQGAIDKLRRAGEPSDLAVLDRHMPRLRAVALQLVRRTTSPEVTVLAQDVWWDDEARDAELSDQQPGFEGMALASGHSQPSSNRKPRNDH